MARNTGSTGTGISGRLAKDNLTPKCAGEGGRVEPVKFDPADGIGGVGAYGHTDLWIGGPTGENVYVLDLSQTTLDDITGIDVGDCDDLVVASGGHDHVFGLTGNMAGCAEFDLFSSDYGMNGAAGSEGSTSYAFENVGDVIIDLHAGGGANVLNLHTPGGCDTTAGTTARGSHVRRVDGI